MEVTGARPSTTIHSDNRVRLVVDGVGCYAGRMTSGATFHRTTAFPLIWRSAALTAAVVIAHLLAIALPFVNEEGAFNSGAAYFRDGDPASIQRFFDLEANTVVLPALGAALSGILHVSTDYGCRLVSIACIVAFAFAIWSMVPSTKRSDALLLQAIILLNPIIWTFSGRGTADFAPMAIAVASIALFWRTKRGFWSMLAAALMFAIAALIKYHVVLLLPFVALAPEQGQSLRFRAAILAMTAVVTAVALVAYNVVIFDEFGFWITPPKFASAHSPTSANMIGNFVRYGGYLALLALPFSLRAALEPSARLSLPLRLVLIAAAFVVGLALPASAGEMNFGPFDRWLGEWFSGAMLSALFAVFILSLIPSLATVGGDRIEYATIAALLLFLLVLSVSRPAQRYLILALPFYFLLVSKTASLRRMAIPTLMVFAALNGFIAFSQVKSGKVTSSTPTAFGQSRRFDP